MPSSSLSSEVPVATLTPCASTCVNAASSACSGCDICADANFQTRMFSCIQGECQAAELADAHLYMAVRCGTTASPPGQVTATTPFLPSNSNADIIIQTSNGNTTSQIVSPSSTVLTHSSSGGTSTATSSHTPAQTSQTTVHRNSSRTAAIAASVVAAIVVFTLAIVLIRLRRRKLRIRERRTPDQFLDSHKHTVQKRPTEKGTVPLSAESAATEINSQFQSNSPSAATMLDDTETQQTIHSPREDPDNAPFTAEESTATSSEPPLEAQAAHGEEPMTLRMRRLEAQVAALLAESSPPSYSG
ncbi:hypothetical protein MSAN_01545900 [Mycena sanguinolenta]|uniref:Extracellular membrane protein CFEM domain-containing protein n=1 Tax=Mycena sanguinolenta TaxID=230812 RepID=A0A8H6Y808_9AGAR|nr:hypothetical protein MSAN_01545900 [Mycena sanguinolenta]